MGTTRTDFEHVRATVLRQHAEIRARLRGLDAGVAGGSSPLAALYLRVSLLRLAVLFESHLLYEELELAPRIRGIDAWGPVREAAMLTEHVEQRMRLEHVCFLAESELTTGAELAREASSLVVTLLEDMVHEEHVLAELDEIAGGVLGQMTG